MELRTQVTMHPSWFCFCSVLCKYVKGHTVAFVNSGEGDVSTWVEQLEKDNINFGIYRVKQVFDGRATASRFMYFYIQPEGTNPLRRARCGTLRSHLARVLQPWHVEFFVTQLEDVTEENVMNAVGKVSGTLSAVTEKKATYKR